MPKNGNDRRAPTRSTKKPAYVLTATIKSIPSHSRGVMMVGLGPRKDTNACWAESSQPACQKPQVTSPAEAARANE